MMKKSLVLLFVLVMFFPVLSIAGENGSIGPYGHARLGPMSFLGKVNGLADRAQITDLLYSFARSIDTVDMETFLSNFDEQGYLEVPVSPTEMMKVYKPDLPAFLQASLFDLYSATHHMITNVQITIEGKTAVSRSYLHAKHIRDDNPADHWDGGGWYDATYVKTREGWKFRSVTLTIVWTGPSTVN